MLGLALLVGQLLSLSQHPWAQVVSPQNCTLDCVLEGDPTCDYCRIRGKDVEEFLGFSVEPFGGCVPRPCVYSLEKNFPGVCQHYVEGPLEVNVEFQPDQNPNYDTVTFSWNPSPFGIAFLRGFQVFLQALGSTKVTCQLFLFQRNLSLSASHTQTVYRSDPFFDLDLGAQFAVTVMALPVPEHWESFYRSKQFQTRTCQAKNGLDECKKDWYPRYVKVQQVERDVIMTFNLAPPKLEISQYFSICYGNEGKKLYTLIKPNLTKNETHYSGHLKDLQQGVNYTCEVAADEQDAVRKTFHIYVQYVEKGNKTSPPVETHSRPLVFAAVVILLLGVFVFLLTVLMRKKLKRRMEKLEMKPDLVGPYYDKCDTNEKPVLPVKSGPPRLLICYRSDDGPEHTRAVLQLASFLQQHMATQVFLDLWESLTLTVEGSMGWYYRKLQVCDFVLVVCSPSLRHTSAHEETCVAKALVGDEILRTKAKGRDLSKYMTAIFEFSEERDVPAVLSLASCYTLPRDLPLLFSHLHGVPLQSCGSHVRVDHISGEAYADLPAGAALRRALQEAGAAYCKQPGPMEREELDRA